MLCGHLFFFLIFRPFNFLSNSINQPFVSSNNYVNRVFYIMRPTFTSQECWAIELKQIALAKIQKP